MKRKKIIIMIVILLIVTGCIFLITNKTFKKEVNIDEILESKEYSYLPYKAKEYIKRIYEETGNIIKTERNKEENEPYLNPNYVTYLSGGENDNEVIPNEMVIDYIYTESNEIEEELPSSYDLRSVDGKNFVTPLKDQGKLGICWDFATLAQAESYLLVKNDTNYEEGVSELFSERQIDYATSSNGIKGYTSEYNNRILGDAGNFRMAIYPMMSEVSPVSNEGVWETYDDTDYSEKYLHEVLNYGNTKYVVNETIEMPVLDFRSLDLNNSDDVEKKEEFLNTVKQNIIKYGGAYVQTRAPYSSLCSAQNILDPKYKYIIDINGACYDTNSHAMQIIGWDDNYEYKYCNYNGENRIYDNSCPAGRDFTGHGAWILKNSWGDKDNTYDYVYLAYDSKYTEISFISELVEKEDNDFKNIYYNTDTTTKLLYEFTKKIYKKINTAETIKKLKFLTISQDRDYNIYISANGDNNYELVKTLHTDKPGLHTVDLSDKNIVVENESFTLKIEDAKGISSVGNTYVVYTENNKHDFAINTKDAIYINHLDMPSLDNYELIVYSDTKNIPSNEQLTYKLYDSEENDLSQYLTFEHNYVAENNANSLIEIASTVEPGNYKLVTYYNNEALSESNVKLNPIKRISGEGTKLNPYIITSPEELNMINEDLKAHYELGNDIDLTEETREGGAFYNNGAGWLPIGGEKNVPFEGTLDGKNHSIIGLYMNSKYYYTGLFNFINANITENQEAFVKNLFLIDFDISSSPKNDTYQHMGMLAGGMQDLENETFSSDPPSVTIENIGIIGGEIECQNYCYSVGTLFGSAYSASIDRVFISNIFSTASISKDSQGIYNGGIIGYIFSPTWNSSAPGTPFDESTLSIKNVRYAGAFPQTSRVVNGRVANIIGYVRGSTQLENILSTNSKHKDPGNYNSSLRTFNLIASASEIERLKYNVLIENAYYFESDNELLSANYDIPLDNVTSKTITELKALSTYENWEEFEDNWEIKEEDGITRLPVLKFVGNKFQYTSLSTDDIELYKRSTISLYDYILPDIEIAKNIVCEIADSTVATVDEECNITGVKVGSTTIHITSFYDGYENDVDVIVNALPSVKFDSNGGTGEMANQEFAHNVSEKISKNTFTKEGYVFDSWNTQADGNGTSYEDEESITLVESITLYAQWAEYDTTITADKTSIDFGETEINFSDHIPRTVTITNTGNVKVKLSVDNPTGSGPFGCLSFGNNKELDPGEEYEITLIGHPSSPYASIPGTYNGDYVITATSFDDFTSSELIIPATILLKKPPMKLSYKTHVQSYGWQQYVSNGAMSGTSGEAKRLEAIRIKLEYQDYTGNIEYRTHIQSYGWEENFKKNDEMSGTSGEGKRLEAIEIKLTGEMADHYDVYYRVHAQSYGWLGWAKNGEQAGTAGFAKRLEGIEIKLIEKDEQFEEYGEKEAFIEKYIEYTTHVQSYGWQNYTYDGNMAGTSGEAKRLEAIKIRLNNPKYNGDIEYRTHIQSYGWEENFKKNDEMSGTSGEAKRLEAIEIRLTGEMADHYDVYYRVHAQSFGWLGWAKNGESSGTAGYAKRLEGIEIILVEKGGLPPIRTNQNDERSYIEK